MSTTATQPVGKHFREPESYFRTEHLHSDIKGRSVRGGAVTMGGQAASFVLKLGSTAILARLLTPADFGLIAMAMVMTGFIEMFKDAGLSMAAVQRAEINHRQVSTLFWINLTLSVLLMCVIAAMAPAIAWFYGEPSLFAITLVLAVLFPLSGLTIQHQALLKRQMRFGLLAIVGVASQATGIAAAITTAAFGASYWALVAMMAATSAANALLVWLFCPWRPGLPSRASGVRPMLAFGGNLTAFSFVNYWARNADNLLVGWYWGAGALGLYTRAYSLMLLPMRHIKEPIGAVAVPALSRLQHRPEQFARLYLRAVNAMMWICGPPVALLAACSEEVILIILGEQWLDAAGVFRILAMIAFFQPIYSTIGWVYISCGRTSRLLRWSAVTCPAIVGAFIVGLPYGPFGVAVAYAIAFVALLPWTLQYAFAGTLLTIRSLARSVAVPWVVSLTVFGTVTFAKIFLNHESARVPLVLMMTLGAGVFLASVLAIPAAHDELRRLIALTSLLGFRNRRAERNCSAP